MLVLGFAANAQNRTITGQVMDKNGQPIEGASIQKKGSSLGVVADLQGNFTISAKTGDVLVISAINFASAELKLGAQSSISITLNSDAATIDEVVVTALGIRRNKNSLPYAAQTVNGEEVAQTRGNNFVSSLSGRVSGLEIRQGNGLGASTNVVIRGAKSLTNSNQALFVVDGVPVSNANPSTATAARGGGGYDYGNAAADINPDDIASVNVLKGAAATALYGSRASNGVVLITTKKGKKGLGITVNSGVSFGSIDKSTYAKYQKEYGAGYQQGGYSKVADGTPNTGFWYRDAFGTGEKSLIVPTTEDASYGMRFDPNFMIYQWDAFDKTSANYQKKTPWVGAVNDPASFYENALSTNNSVMLDGGDDKATFKLGYTRSEEKGVVPNSKLLKNIVNFGATYKLLDNLTASASINYSKINGKGRYGTGYDKQNQNQGFRQWWQTNVDIKQLKDAYFRTKQNITWNWADPTTPAGIKPIYTDNPYWNRYQNYETDSRNRYMGNMALNYQATSWLSFMGRVSIDGYDELQEERIAVGSIAVPSYIRANNRFQEINYDLMANLDKDLNEHLNLKAILGTNIRKSRYEAIRAGTNGGLVVPNLYSLANSVNPINGPVEASDLIATDGYFGGITLTYNEYLTLDATYRKDRASTLPSGNNSYMYPAISGSFLFSKLLTNTTWLSSGKLRANYAEVGNSAPFGSLQDLYDKPTAFGNATLFSLPNTKNNPNLKPERTKSQEIGLEMAFLSNRLGFDLTYYNTKTYDQIIPVSVSAATGYSFKYVNSGIVQNKGVELSMFATPIKTKDFSWNININWTRNRNKVLELYDSSKNLQINSMQGGVSVNATIGEAYGTIQGKTWKNVDGNPWKPGDGPKLVGANGYYALTTATDNVIGNINPDWTGGIYNTFKYKNVSLGFLIDVRQGGDVFSLDMYYGLATGMFPETVGNNDLGNPKRSPISEGGGLIVPGVTADGKVNTKRVENTSYGYYGYSYNPAAAFVYDASYVKLRELNLTYSLPQTLITKLRAFKGIDVSVIGRNLWIIHKNLPYADPEENITSGNTQGYQSGAYPTTRSVGFNIKLKF